MRQSNVILAVVAAFVSVPAGAAAHGSGDWKVSLNKDKTVTLMCGKDTVLENIGAEYRDRGRTVDLSAYSKARIRKKRVDTDFGPASQVDVAYSGDSLLGLCIRWQLYKDSPFVTVQGTVSSDDTLAVNRISPVTASGQAITFGKDTRALFVPFDNDAWIRYSSKPAGFGQLQSYEVTSVFGNGSRDGYVFGSIDHDRWKSAVVLGSADTVVTDVTLMAGVADKLTRDVLEHGAFHGRSVSSPRFFIGRFGDWREGLEAFGDANAVVAPPRKWSRAMPVGWNSWGALAFDINYRNATEVADFIHDNLQGSSFMTADSTLYIGLDSGWNFLSEEQLASFVRRCHDNGQLAGVYWTPFTDWGKNPEARMDHAEEYTFSDAYLYADGKPQELDGAYALDPTHPAVIRRIEYYSDLFRRLGFSYVKLDFMTHGAMEADSWHDPSIQSGMQAYNAGMSLIDKCFEGMYINLSISPSFPANYANSRRIACDAWGWMKDTEYTLNATSYGWWLDRVYNYNDADHIVLKDASPGENRARVTSGVITGIYIFGDDVSATGSDDVKARAVKYLTNAKVNAAATGESFRPVEGDGEMSENQFISACRDGVRYYAVFNYSDAPAQFDVLLDRLGLESGAAYDFEELWSGEHIAVDGDFVLDIPAKDVKFFSITEK